MKFKQKIVSSIMFMFILALVLQSNVNAAALQSNGNTAATKGIDNWMLQIRQMETLGGTLGLDDTINSSTLKSTATTSNGLDIHMQKNTEYGAMALLSASNYGNPNKIADGQTTTGNSTGVVMRLKTGSGTSTIKTEIGETVAATVQNPSLMNTTKTAMGRYKNVYNFTGACSVIGTPKKGDALLSWHGSTANSWYYNTYCVLVRAYSGSIFSFFGGIGYPGHGAGPSDSMLYPTRAVIVMGEGF